MGGNIFGKRFLHHIHGDVRTAYFEIIPRSAANDKSGVFVAAGTGFARPLGHITYSVPNDGLRKPLQVGDEYLAGFSGCTDPVFFKIIQLHKLEIRGEMVFVGGTTIALIAN